MKRLLVAGLFLSSIMLLGCTNKTQDNDSVINLDNVAQCLTSKGVKMYGTETCSHCIDQKDLFGDSFKYITYVDCASDPNACSKIEGTPTREFSNGELLPGKQRISLLAQKAGCDIK